MAGIYLHIPFCKQACYYCDFHFSTSLERKEEMILALQQELINRKDEFGNETVATIYFGGGTPSLLSVQEIENILETIYSHYSVISNPEITLEANPDDLTNDVLFTLSKSPINRLSIGIQSFFEADLKAMNRAHNANEAKQCLKTASIYFKNITIDLIYGIPNMSLKRWNENLEIAFSFNVPHISSYALTVENKTALAAFIKKGTYPPVDEELALSHFNHLVAATEKEGFIQYEISNFGKSEYFSKHNTSYWKGEKYLGIGPSAHSFNGIVRSWNVSNNKKYITAINNKELASTSEKLTINDRYNEYVMTGLRTIWGVSLEVVEREFGSDYKKELLVMAQSFIEQKNLILTKDNILMTTLKGKFLADGIASELFII